EDDGLGGVRLGYGEGGQEESGQKRHLSSIPRNEYPEGSHEDGLPQISFCLVDPESDFQQVLREDAEAAARAETVALDVFWCGHALASQLKEIGRRLAAPPRPDALLVLAVRDQGLGHLVRDAVR